MPCWIVISYVVYRLRQSTTTDGRDLPCASYICCNASMSLMWESRVPRVRLMDALAVSWLRSRHADHAGESQGEPKNNETASVKPPAIPGLTLE